MVAMTVHPESGDGAPDEARALAESPMVAGTREITERTWTATSPDGHVTVVVGGDQRLRQVTVNTPDAPAGLLGRSATVATNDALATARREIVTAMRELPELPAELRRLLGGTT